MGCGRQLEKARAAPRAVRAEPQGRRRRVPARASRARSTGRDGRARPRRGRRCRGRDVDRRRATTPGGRRGAGRARRAKPLTMRIFTQLSRSTRKPVIARANATPTSRNAPASPSEYAVRSTIPFATVPVALASTSTEPRTAPTHGAAHTANAAPSSAVEPSRARTTRPGASIRSGHGSNPANASPKTTSRSPASSIRRSGASTDPSAAAPAPSRTKTTVNPRTKGTLPASTRRGVGEPPPATIDR